MVFEINVEATLKSTTGRALRVGQPRSR